MSQRYVCITAIIVTQISLGVLAQVDAADFTITSENSLELDVGDYASIAGVAPKELAGETLDILTVNNSSNGQLVSAPSRDMGDLWTTLDNGDVTSTSILVFGLIVNEVGGSPNIDFTTLSMSFGRVGGGTDSFGLSPDQFSVYEYNGGVNPDAKIQVNLGFDFMSEYSATSTEQFTFSTTISNMTDGDEFFYLTSGFTANPPVPEEHTPEPGTLVLFSVVLTAAVLARRKWGKQKQSPTTDSESPTDETNDV